MRSSITSRSSAWLTIRRRDVACIACARRDARLLDMAGLHHLPKLERLPLDAARAALTLNPQLTIANARDIILSAKSYRAEGERILEGLRKAGLPEGPCRLSQRPDPRFRQALLCQASAHAE